jgi:hypothetical protein
MGVTTDPNDRRLHKGIDSTETGQHEVYLVLSEEERAKGFVRPYRDSYIHVGIRPKYPLRDLTAEEMERHGKWGYSKYEAYSPDEWPLVGKFWRESDLRSGCGQTTKMGWALSETYAREPKFYGATYCCTCRMHLSVEEFVWESDGTRVGS